MKSNPTAFVFIVAVLRLVAIYLILSPVYLLAYSIFRMGAGGGIAGFVLLETLRPLLAAVVLWFLARPIGKLVLRDFDNVPA
jgi:hypothetical protein